MNIYYFVTLGISSVNSWFYWLKWNYKCVLAIQPAGVSQTGL